MNEFHDLSRSFHRCEANKSDIIAGILGVKSPEIIIKGNNACELFSIHAFEESEVD